MKIKSLNYFYALLVFSIASFQTAYVSAALTPAQQAAYEFVEEFLNPKKNIGTPFNQYHERMIQIIALAKTENPRQLEEFVRLENKLNTIVTENNQKLRENGKPVSAIKFGTTFKEFKELLPTALRAKVENLLKQGFDPNHPKRIKTTDLLRTFKQRLSMGGSVRHRQAADDKTARQTADRRTARSRR